MPHSSPSSSSLRLGPFVLIAAVVGIAGLAFLYTAGWLTPHRLTPAKLVGSLAPPGGPSLGHRRNHAKGICFTGTFAADGAGSALSKAALFRPGQYPVIGRFNLATADASARDAMVRVRGIGIQITGPGGSQWRSAMIDAPVFAVSTPQGFYELQVASHSKDPSAMKAFAAAHPEFAAFGAWAKTAPWTSSYAEERFNSLDSFLFTGRHGDKHAVRWSLIPSAQPVAITPAELASRGPDYLEREITQRVANGPQTWTLQLTVANPGDPTADPSKAWPADRRTVNAGTLTVQQVEPESDGPCRDINYDPTVLPDGITTSDDPFPAARSSAYAVSYDRRTAEARYYPRTGTAANAATGAQQ